MATFILVDTGFPDAQHLPLTLRNSRMDSANETEFRYDHGIVAWTQVFATFLMTINVLGITTAFGVFESYWVSALNRTPADIAWIGALQLCLLYLVGPFSGRLMDAGHFRVLFCVGGFLQLLGIFTSSLVKTYWQLVLSQGVVQGVGNGVILTPFVALISIYFKKHRAVAIALGYSGSSAGGIIYTLVGSFHP